MHAVKDSSMYARGIYMPHKPWKLCTLGLPSSLYVLVWSVIPVFGVEFMRINPSGMFFSAPIYRQHDNDAENAVPPNRRIPPTKVSRHEVG
jgi:hypothetical protein